MNQYLFKYIFWQGLSFINLIISIPLYPIWKYVEWSDKWLFEHRQSAHANYSNHKRGLK